MAREGTNNEKNFEMRGNVFNNPFFIRMWESQ